MPTYSACGITARLSTCDLGPTLSSFTDLRMGNEQRKDAARIQKVLSGGEKLSERPIGLDGSEKGVVQFIGVHEDMPLFVVEASEKLRNTSLSTAQEGPAVPSSSPLTFLDAMPTPTQESVIDTIQVEHVKRGKPQAKTQEGANPQVKSRRRGKSQSAAESQTFEDAIQQAHTTYKPTEHALVLDIEVAHESFLPARGGSASLGKDLKIEVFVNGELADVSFVNARRSAVQIIGDKIRFAGTRVHRQTEKPWVYAPDDASETAGDGEQRWDAIANTLISHARLRGTDKCGDLQPSAEFLGALAAVPFPERLRAQGGIGVVDILITAGKGQKYGPDTAYLTRPTNMDDPDFTTGNPAVDPMLLPPSEPVSLLEGGAVVSPLEAMKRSGDQQVESSSPDIPLRARSRLASASTLPSPSKKARNLAQEFGFELTKEESKLITMGAFENRRGKAGPEGRTLLQRLGDLKKMNERNQGQALQQLKDELGDFLTASRAEHTCASSSPTAKDAPPPKKRQRTNSDAAYIDPSKTSFVNPHAMHLPTNPADDVFTTTTADPDAVLAQTRINMALTAGAPSAGPLLRRIASTSPVKKSPRKTTASALAYSPTCAAIKSQQRASSKPDTNTPPPQPNFILPQQTPSPSKSAGGRGTNRSATKWDPREPSFAETLAGFAPGEACVGSCVGFAREKRANRQIGKARGGVFREEGVVVGVRFCVW